MALKIVWTPKADEGLEKVLEYLDKEWTVLEILKLEQNLNKLLNHIKKYPESSPKTTLYKNLYKGFVDKNNYIIYRINIEEDFIEIINFRGTKQSNIY
jgi:plasmid stabilization system protein ParE